MRELRALAPILAVGLAIGLAACGGDRGDENPQAVLDGATLEGIESGDVDLSIGLEAQGPEGGQVEFTLSGPFQGEGVGNLPLLDLTSTAKGRYNGEKIDFEGGVVLLPNSAYVSYEGSDYEVDATTFSIVESALNQAQREAGADAESAGAAACQERLGRLQVADFFAGPTNRGGAEVAGTETTEISGRLDVPAAIEALLEVARSPACRAQLAIAGPLPSEAEIEDAREEVAGSVRRARATVYVGDDDIVRRLELQATIEPRNGGKGPKRFELDVDLELNGVNEGHTIIIPANAKPLSGLYQKLGVEPLELLELLQGEGGEESLEKLFEGLGVPGGVPGLK